LAHNDKAAQDVEALVAEFQAIGEDSDRFKTFIAGRIVRASRSET